MKIKTDTKCRVKNCHNLIICGKVYCGTHLQGQNLKTIKKETV